MGGRKPSGSSLMPSKSYGSVKVFWPAFDRDTLVAVLRRRLAALSASLPVQQAVLFGSYANGRQAPGSDIDVLIIYSGSPRDDAYRLVKTTLGIPQLEPHVYAEDEYRILKPTIDRMARDGMPIQPERL